MEYIFNNIKQTITGLIWSNPPVENNSPSPEINEAIKQLALEATDLRSPNPTFCKEAGFIASNMIFQHHGDPQVFATQMMLELAPLTEGACDDLATQAALALHAQFRGIALGEAAMNSLQGTIAQSRNPHVQSCFCNLNRANYPALFINKAPYELRGPYAFENESGYLAGLANAYEYMISTLGTPLTSDFIISIHDKCCERTYRTNHYSAIKNDPEVFEIWELDNPYHNPNRAPEDSVGVPTLTPGVRKMASVSYCVSLSCREALNEISNDPTLICDESKVDNFFNISYISTTLSVNNGELFNVQAAPLGGDIVEATENFNARVNVYIQTYIDASKKNEDEVIDAIVNLCRSLDMSHFFNDGNYRTAHIVLNKLLIENNLSPCALDLPSFSGHTTLELRALIKDGQARFKELAN